MAVGQVLLVDDDRALRDAVGRALRLEGFEVTLATDGPEALELALKSPRHRCPGRSDAVDERGGGVPPDAQQGRADVGVDVDGEGWDF